LPAAAAQHCGLAGADGQASGTGGLLRPAIPRVANEEKAC